MKLKEATIHDLMSLPGVVVDQMLAQADKRADARSVEHQGVYWLVDRVSVAKAAAKARRHEGRFGGWIYNAAGRPICQGWVEYYHRTGVASWVREQRRYADEPVVTNDAEDRANRGGW